MISKIKKNQINLFKLKKLKEMIFIEMHLLQLYLMMNIKITAFSTMKIKNIVL